MFSKIQFSQIFEDTLARAGAPGSSSQAPWSGPSDSTTSPPTSTPSVAMPSTASTICLGWVMILFSDSTFVFSRGCNLLPEWPAPTRSSGPRSHPQAAQAEDCRQHDSIKRLTFFVEKKVVFMKWNIVLFDDTAPVPIINNQTSLFKRLLKWRQFLTLISRD